MRKLVLFVVAFFIFAQNALSQASSNANSSLVVGHQDSIRAIAWSPDHKKIISHSVFDQNLCLWDVESQKLLWFSNTYLHQERLQKPQLKSFDWSSDQTLIASASDDGQIQLWNADSGKLLWNIEADQEKGHLIRFSPDDKFLAAIGNHDFKDSRIRLFSVKDGSLIKEFAGEAGRVIAADFSGQEGYLFTGNRNGEIAVWDILKGEKVSSRLLNLCGKNDDAMRIGYSPDLKYLVAECSKSTIAAETKTSRKITFRRNFDYKNNDVFFSGDGNRFIFRRYEQLTIFDIKKRSYRKIKDTFNGLSFALDYDGRRLAEGSALGSEGIRIIDSDSSREMARFQSRPGVIESLAFSKNGRYFASGSADRRVRVFEAETCQMKSEFRGHLSEPIALSFSDDGKTLVSKSEKETFTWDLTKKVYLKREPRGEHKRETFAKDGLSLDGKFRAEFSKDGESLKIIDTANSKEVEFPALKKDFSIAFTPDRDQFIASSFYEPLQLWDIARREKIRDFDTGFSYENSLAFSPDGKRFITGGENQNILQYEIDSGKLVCSLFPIDRRAMESIKLHESRRLKFLRDKEEVERIADVELAEASQKVFIAFSHFGNMSDPGKKKMLESDEPKESKSKKSAKEANAAWLIIRNDSPLPIQIPTLSLYLDPKCFFVFPSGIKVDGLCDKREISIWHGLKNSKGEWIPFGFDFGGAAILLPKTSALFPVPLTILGNGNYITFQYKFQKDAGENKIADYGTPKELKFSKMDMPRE